MKLHLIRHAKALQPELNQHDFKRSLSDRGKQQAKALGKYLNDKGLTSEVWCSDAVRTKQTLEIIGLENRFEKITFFNEFYLCPKQTFLEKLWLDDSEKDIVIVGHNFGISDLANYFLDDVIEMRTCEYLCIEFKTEKRNETSRDTGMIVDRWKYD